MTSTIIHIALLLWSGLLIIAGAMLIISSQLGHLAEAVEAANRATHKVIREPAQFKGITAAADSDLIIPMPTRIGSHRSINPGRSLLKSIL